jgi:phage gpG-like protein
MFVATISGTFPTSALDLSPWMQQCSIMMLDNIRRAFGQGGDPHWLPLKSGGPSFLFQSGALLQSNAADSGADFAEAGQFGGPIYQWIHQTGGVINHPGTQNGFGRGIEIPPHMIPIPARPYAVWNEELVGKCLDVLQFGAVKFLNTNGEPINARSAA